MVRRFEGPSGRKTLTEVLREQKFVSGDPVVAEHVASVAELLEVPAGRPIIQQGGSDNDVYLIVCGAFDIIINGHKVARRFPNDHVGEMAAVQPTQRRSATVVAAEDSVVCKLTEPQLTELGKEYPDVWRRIAKELARRLEQRNSLITAPRDQIRVFVISSAEALGIARTIETAFEYDPFDVKVWTNGVFRASWYPIESLEHELDRSDFALAVAQPDDVTHSRGEAVASPRDNVIFELGFFMGRLGRRRSILLEPRSQTVKLPSDLVGITTVTYKFGDGKDLTTALAPACNRIRDIITELGPNN